MSRLLIAAAIASQAASAQPRTPARPAAAPAATAPAFDSSLFRALQWRLVGPFRGGRANAVAGVTGQRNVYYAGYTGGGLWKTDDAGHSWKNISDGSFRTSSIGAIAVAESDPDRKSVV